MCKGPKGELKWVSLGWDSRTLLQTRIFRLRLEEWEEARERDYSKTPSKELTNAKSRRQKRTSNFRKAKSRLVWLNLSEREDREGTGSRWWW